MMLPIKRFFDPPVFSGDEAKTRRVALLNAALIHIFTLVPVYLIGNLLGGRTPPAVYIANMLALVVCLALRWMMHRGCVRMASIGLMAMGLILITAASASLGTIRTPSATMYLLMVITGGLLFDMPGMAATTAVCSLLIGGLIAAENGGLLPPPDYSVTITQWIALTATFAWTGSLTFSSLKMTRQILAQADKEIAERKRMEEKDHEQRRFLTNMLEAITNPFYVINADDYTIALSNQAAHLDRSNGKSTCYSLTHNGTVPCSTDQQPCPLEIVRKTGKATVVEHVHSDENGAKRVMEVHGYPVFDAQGKFFQMIE